MSFRQWIIKTNLRTDAPIGDLARDVSSDPNFPKGENRLRKLHSYLKWNNACKEALDTLCYAWKEYKRSARKP